MTSPVKEIPQALARFISGDISWRAACKELGLWDYDALLSMMREYGLEHHLPSREESTALEERLNATLNGKKES